ncbi:hypothetical protein ABZ135_32720 [Streptomyces sp. NPDC006339]|uniref:hypothetical protein n=1 Tax=Streptomyces sp. NPDC006339 TaxID=3156755 RepID=UPI0033B90CDE
MLFFGLSPLARKAFLALAVVVLAITLFTPDAGSSAKPLPLGVVITNTGTQVTVRTGDGELHTVDTTPADVAQCTAGRTFPTCSH